MEEAQLGNDEPFETLYPDKTLFDINEFGLSGINCKKKKGSVSRIPDSVHDRIVSIAPCFRGIPEEKKSQKKFWFKYFLRLKKRAKQVYLEEKHA